MSTNPVRQRGHKDRSGTSTPPPTRDGKPNGSLEKQIESLAPAVESAVKSQWDYKLALIIITSLAFVTRFWGIGHPNEVVFDEVHFGKVRPAPPGPLPRAKLPFELCRRSRSTVHWRTLML